jgi:hypothetical protein
MRCCFTFAVASATDEGGAMKALMIPLALTLAGGLAAASDMPKASQKEGAAMKETTLKGEVVSTNADAKQLVLKTSSGDETLTVTGKAAAQLKELNAGEKVSVKERNNEVYSIAIPKAKAKHHASASSHTAQSASRKY